MADTERGISYKFPQTGGNKSAPERNGNLENTESYAFSQLDLETQMAVLRFNTNPERSMMSLEKKLALLRGQSNNGNGNDKAHSLEVLNFNSNEIQQYIVADNRGTYLLKNRLSKVVLDRANERATVSTVKDGEVQVEVYHPLTALSFGQEPVFLSPTYSGVYD